MLKCGYIWGYGQTWCCFHVLLRQWKRRGGGGEERGPLLSAWMKFTGAICYMLEIRCLLVASQESQDSASLFKSGSCFSWSSPVLFLFLWWSSTCFNFCWVAVFSSGILFPTFTPVLADLPQPHSLNRLVVCTCVLMAKCSQQGTGSSLEPAKTTML